MSVMILSANPVEGKMLELIYVFVKETKNYSLYRDEADLSSPMNSLYLPKGLPHRIKVTVTEA